jgi:hypothetical protein
MVFSKINGNLHHREKQLVESLRHSPRSSNPFLITERQDEKQLCISYTMKSINCQMRHLRNYGLGHALTGSKSLDERKIVHMQTAWPNP